MLIFLISAILFNSALSYSMLAGFYSSALSKSSITFFADNKSLVPIYLTTTPYLYTQESAWDLKV